MLGDLLKFKDLLALLVMREIRIRYARAALGAAWALFGPVVMMAIFVVLDFGRLVPPGNRWSGVPYSVFAYVGLLFWTCFATSITQATPSLVVAADILRKSAFPREVIPLAKVLASLFDLLIGLVFLVLLMGWKDIEFHVTVLAIPAVFALQLLFTVGLALLLSAANLFFRDVNYLVQVLLIMAMFATSVVYPLTVSDPVARTVLAWNPMSAFLDAYRQCLLLGEWPGSGLLPGIVGALLVAVLGWTVFHRLSPRFAEEI